MKSIFQFGDPETTSIFEKFNDGCLCKISPKLNQTWTYSTLGPDKATYGPDLLNGKEYVLLFLGLDTDPNSIYNKYAKFLFGEQIFYISEQELMRCNVFVYDNEDL